MRKVVVDGQIYELPDGGDYVVMSHEMTPPPGWRRGTPSRLGEVTKSVCRP